VRVLYFQITGFPGSSSVSAKEPPVPVLGDVGKQKTTSSR
jgi:hypothetical protein